MSESVTALFGGTTNQYIFTLITFGLCLYHVLCSFTLAFCMCKLCTVFSHWNHWSLNTAPDELLTRITETLTQISLSLIRPPAALEQKPDQVESVVLLATFWLNLLLPPCSAVELQISVIELEDLQAASQREIDREREPASQPVSQPASQSAIPISHSSPVSCQLYSTPTVTESHHEYSSSR